MLMILGIGLGAACGAWVRWLCAMLLNPLFANLPLGTLLVNLVGAYLIGCAMGIFAVNLTISPEVRMIAVTGFLGGLTTFSSFSSEVVTLFLRQEIGWGIATIASHVFGSLCLTGLGLWTVTWLRGT